MSQSRFERIEGVDYYTINGAERLAEFFMSAVSSGEHWMFISSMGALTAGRRDAEGALFPYETVDKVMAGKAHTGSRTRILVSEGGSNATWDPFADWTSAVWPLTRSVSKAKTGHLIRFEERNLSLRLSFGYSWGFSARYGFVRKAFIRNEGDAARRIVIIDGLYNLMSGGVTRRLQDRFSCLADAYKDNVLDPQTGLAAYSLASAITDRAEPREALKASAAWSVGPQGRKLSLSRDELGPDGAFIAGAPRTRALGKKGDYILRAELDLAPGASESWYIVADVGLDHAALAALRGELRRDGGLMAERLEAERKATGDELEAVLGAVDGLSAGELPMHEWHHAANALFNAMRGGYPVGGMRVDPADLVSFIRGRNRAAGERAAALLEGAAGADGRVGRDEAMALLAPAGSPDLARLAREYVPLSFSRRHGDPSRPWNEFSIRVRDASGAPVLDYQGNWRDIFQNWEALGRSYPAYLESFIALFLDATTVDGYNPYRISRAGLDWEREDPEDPWSNIGYWNDHQLIYLQKLVESYEAHFPGALAASFGERRYAWADVPYRIAGYDEIRRNPRSTIRFDAAADRAAEERVARDGGDGRLVRGADGGVMHAGLLDKVVALFAAKLGNLVPGGGVWMNTQRPEWNDANNALAGYGLSMVTAMYMRRFAAFWNTMIRAGGEAEFKLARPLAELVGEQLAVMEEAGEGAQADPRLRRRFIDGMGRAHERYRARVYADPSALAELVPVRRDSLERWFDSSLKQIDATIGAGKRPDGLYDAYSLLSLDGDEARVERLYPMLEGQVAALSSGALGPEEAVELMAALRSGPLYCADRKTWLLYPDRELPDFFAKNRCPEGAVASSPLAQELLAAGRGDIIYRDAEGIARFAPALVNEAELASALDALAAEPGWAEPLARGRRELEALYESTFRHAGFTGRSGGMYAYEGLGSVYWHMVAKLLLTLAELRENLVLSGRGEARPELVEALERAYLDAREGIGYRRSPEEWGAFPFDPYSHTPKGSGARQPGMTGQVKEELLTRLMEFGLAVGGGVIRFAQTGLLNGEFLSAPRDFVYYDARGRRASIGLKAGEMVLCLAGVPFVREGSAGPIRIAAEFADGGERGFDGALDAELSASIFNREGRVSGVRVSGGVSRS